MTHSVLIVDHNELQAQRLASTLADLGIDAIGMVHDEKTLEAVTPSIKVLVIDLNIRYSAELGLLAQIRRYSDAAIIIQCNCNDELERIIALEMGADDILSYPCNPRELAAKIRNIFRRYKTPSISLSSPQVVRFGSWKLTPNTRELHSNTGSRSSLSASGYALLTAFLKNPLTAISREDLCKALGREYSPHDRTIDIKVCQLRQKLGTQGDKTPYIKTLRAQGYVFLVGVDGME